MDNIKEGQNRDSNFYGKSIAALVLGSMAILINILIIKAYNKNEQFEKHLKDIQEKNSKNCINNLVKGAIEIFEEKTLKKEDEKKPDTEKNLYEPQTLQRQTSVSPAFRYLRPHDLEEDQDREYNSNLSKKTRNFDPTSN